MKKVSFSIAFLIFGVIVLIVVHNKLLSNNNKSVSINFEEIKYIKLVSLPVPPRYKVVNDEKDIKKIAEFISKLKVETYSTEGINGWIFMLKIKFKNGEENDFVVVNNNLISYDNKFYCVNNNVETFFKQLYPHLEYEELEWLNKSKNDNGGAKWKRLLYVY